MAVNRKVEPYNLDLEYERALIALLCKRPKLFARIGHSIEADALAHDLAKTLLRTAQAIAQECGNGPDSHITVMQRLHLMQTAGRVNAETIKHCRTYLDMAEAAGLPNEDQAAQGIIPILQHRAKYRALMSGMDAFGKEKDMTQVVRDLDKAAHLGETTEGIGVKLGSGSFDAIKRIRGLRRLSFDVPEVDTLLEGGLWRKALGVVIAPSGGGKCHAKGQGILLHNGSIKKVENIVIGDRLAAPDGGFRTVLMTNRGHGEMVDIKPHKGSSWRVNLDHILTIAPQGKLPLVDVSVKEFLTWSKWARREAVLVRCAAEFSAKKVLPLDPYVLGVILGDGSSVAPSLTITTADVEIVGAIRAYADLSGLRLVAFGDRGKAQAYRLVNKQGVKNCVLNALELLNLRGKTSGDKFVPECYKTASTTDRLLILAGLLDTDGYYRGGNRGYDYVTKSRQLAADVVFLARSVGVAAYMSECRKCCGNTGVSHTYYRVGITGEVAIIPCRVPRKKAVCQNRRLNALHTRFEIVPVGRDDFYGFTLDGDGRYLLDDFTVTHNSIFLSHQTAVAMRGGYRVALATLELPEALIIARLKANLLGMTIDEILNGSLTKAEKEFATLAPQLGLCVVKEFAPKATTINHIFSWVKEVETDEGAPIDLLVVDYADKLGTGRSDESTYTTGGTVFEGLRHYAVERDIWCWTASQPKRMTKGQKRIELDDVADSMNKVRVADVVLTVNPKDDGDQLLYYLAKNRMGKTGQSVGPLPQEFEFGRVAPVVSTEDYASELFE